MVKITRAPKHIKVKSHLGNEWLLQERPDILPLSKKLISEAAGYQALLFNEFAKYHDVQDMRVLEIGSDGNLNTARMFVEQGAAEVHACNLKDIFNRAHASGQIHLHVGDAGDLDLLDQSFDVIYGIALLEHIPDYSPLVRTIARLLAPDGIAYLHGDPLWTGPHGHHVYCVTPEGCVSGVVKYRFNDPAYNPIPDWAHLTMDHWSLADHLECSGINRIEAREIADFVYGLDPATLGDSSNKKSARDVQSAFQPFFDTVAFIGVHDGPGNEYFRKALKYYSEDDLRAKGMTLRLRHRKPD